MEAFFDDLDDDLDDFENLTPPPAYKPNAQQPAGEEEKKEGAEPVEYDHFGPNPKHRAIYKIYFFQQEKEGDHKNILVD